MYTVKINDDNTVSVVAKQRIVQMSKLVDELYFIVPKKYNEYEMKDFEFWMQYKVVGSHEFNLEQLKLVDEDYKNDYLRYTTDFDTNLTKDDGTIEIQLKFINQEMNTEGETTQRVRNIEKFSIDVTPVDKWFVAPDAALDELTQVLLANRQNIQALKDIAEILYNNKADDLIIDKINKKLKVSANGVAVGKGVDLAGLGDEVAEANEKGLNKVFI